MTITVHRFTGQELITLPVLFEGKRRETIMMAVDTGATYTMIPWKIAQSLGFEPERIGHRILITTASNTEEAPLIVLPKIFLLGKILRQVAVVVHDLPPTSRIDGLLGLNVLRKLPLRIDFQKEIIEIS